MARLASRAFCEERLAETSICRLLARDGHLLFPDEAFADLFLDTGRGRCSVPPRIVAVVMAGGDVADYTNQERRMSPLAAMAHKCDVASARLWCYHPAADDEPHPT